METFQDLFLFDVKNINLIFELRMLMVKLIVIGRRKTKIAKIGNRIRGVEIRHRVGGVEVWNRMGGVKIRGRRWNRHAGQNRRIWNRQIRRRDRCHHLVSAVQRRLMLLLMVVREMRCSAPRRSRRGGTSGSVDLVAGSEDRNLRCHGCRWRQSGRRWRDVGADLARRRSHRPGHRRRRTRGSARSELEKENPNESLFKV